MPMVAPHLVVRLGAENLWVPEPATEPTEWLGSAIVMMERSTRTVPN